ncbi:MAG TPA: DUF3040 domain-containing protein [Segeticoccus sp.]|uniref:DUF3040 domain-containing protein n=1 Tax=Segeticoccus sp. TaxID=2706531 RepID=UPI002D7EB4BB|nr:DUF3040 domain-containing protein [Segeticoccus sp.]HET8600277.1 DUF3040 domain-containing protein [Segeticoccus sp.]
MPLSEHEQHLLEQMEQALYAEDPKFASHMVGSVARHRLHQRIAIGVIAGIVGLVLVVLGVMSSMIWLGAVGFVIMVAGAVWAITPPGRRPHLGTVREDGTVAPPPQPKARAKDRRKSKGGGRGRRGSGSHGTFMQRMEQRWDRRHDQGGGGW